MQLGDGDVRDALVARKKAGANVRAILADPGWIDANAEAAAFLAQNGIDARWVGSINLSWTSLTNNREVGLVVTEKANIDAIRGTFEKHWATATPF